jgi:putative RNA 2'-phosphotransferase
MSPNHEKTLSKFLSLVLRHQPEVIGITLDENGWTDVEAFLKAINTDRQGKRQDAITRAELDFVVANNAKQRFAYNDDHTRIRANQGHSVDVELGYEAAEPPAILYHGTSTMFLSNIEKEGLKKMDRHHVHLSPTTDVAMQVAKRRMSPIVLKVDTARMKSDGHVFYRSANGVWLTDAVPFAYISWDEKPFQETSR